ncbi:squalene--hopene cyclase [bacterium LRH843]|nr:squalene--hopene cyclase [bacterium LRH843]
MTHHTKNLRDKIVKQLKDSQTPDGYWDYPFETGIETDAYMIILLKSLEINDEDFIYELTKRIISKQEENGAWKLYYDEDRGNLSATVEAYYALLYSGYYKKDDDPMRAAKAFILKNGGMEASHMLTKTMLATTGQLPWTRFPIPVESILLPLSFPINFYDFAVFGRATLAPLMVIASKKYYKKTKKSPDLSDLFVSAHRSYRWFECRDSERIVSEIEQGIKNLLGLPEYIHSLAIQRTKQYMLSHIEPDGTLYSYFSSTFLMIFALLSLGFSPKDPVILKAINGLKGMKCKINGQVHMQFTTASIWNTSLISYVLQHTGISSTDPVIVKANQYLLQSHQYKYGDWAIHNSDALPGGWGFSHSNTMNPDVDDTTASLRALSQSIGSNTSLLAHWDAGIRWVSSMQNDDGGWPAFEKNVDKTIINLFPVEGGKFLLTDPSSADLTGRTLEFFGNFTNLPKQHPMMKHGVNWLLRHQEKNGSWYGRWGICYLYGTWAALTGLASAGISSEHSAVKRAVQWLHHIQNKDGGWGESCQSDFRGMYIPLGNSNITQTAWALDALIAFATKPTPEIDAGIDYLLSSYDQKDWTKQYPVGQALGGGFYIDYHSYQFVFPLLALANYEKTFNN